MKEDREWSLELCKWLYLWFRRIQRLKQSSAECNDKINIWPNIRLDSIKLN